MRKKSLGNTDEREKSRKLTEAEQRRLDAFEEMAEERIRRGYERVDLTVSLRRANVFGVILLIPLLIGSMLLFFLLHEDVTGFRAGTMVHPRHHLGPVCRASLEGHPVRIHPGIPDALLHLHGAAEAGRVHRRGTDAHAPAGHSPAARRTAGRMVASGAAGGRHDGCRGGGSSHRVGSAAVPQRTGGDRIHGSSHTGRRRHLSALTGNILVVRNGSWKYHSGSWKAALPSCGW